MKVEIELKNLENIKVEVKQKMPKGEDAGPPEIVRHISFDCLAHAGDVGRIISLLDRRAPVHCIIGSNQAALDLRFESVEAEEKKKVLVPA